MGVERHVKIFRNGRNQAVRIPVEFELPGDEAIMRQEGGRLIIEPVKKSGLLEWLRAQEPLDEEFPNLEEDSPLPKDFDL